ncbi:hypothetical protein AB0D49_17795 [Streptomyces sp. NPDC048290]|uniref:hypothetical protein n=1 Tax=Streptomyces sp. NPDC048290 TaxID=3155811 RepID=UPI003444ECC2
MKRWGWAGSGVVLALLLSGCNAISGGGGGADDLLRPTPQSSAEVGAGGLGSLSLASSEVDGFAVSGSADRREVRDAPDDCAPLAQALSGAVVADPESTEARQVTGEGAIVTVVLAGYGDGKASAAMDRLAASTDRCAEGFTVTVDGAEHRFEAALPELAPQGAEQAMALSARVEQGEEKTPVKVVVLRQGNTLAYLSAIPDGVATKDFAVPPPVIGAQLLKLAQ